MRTNPGVERPLSDYEAAKVTDTTRRAAVPSYGRRQAENTLAEGRALGAILG